MAVPRAQAERLRWKLRVVRLDDAHDDAEDAQCGPKDLHDENLNEETRVLSICDGAAAPGHAHADAALAMAVSARDFR